MEERFYSGKHSIGRAQNELKMEGRFKKASFKIFEACVDHHDFKDFNFRFDPLCQCFLGQGSQKSVFSFDLS